MKIYINGKNVEASEAKISVFDRSYLFGEGLFETLRSYDGSLPFLDKHLARMEWSATFLGLPFPHPVEIKRGITNLLVENKLPNARIKILLSGINEGIRPHLAGDNTALNLVILTEPFEPFPASDYEKGVRLSVVHSIKNDPPPVSNMKTLSLVSRMIARQEFMEHDAYDGILASASGHVTETTSSNIFWVRDDIVYTPPSSLGLLSGITRDLLKEIFKEHKIKLKEQAITAEELKNASEVFITGSTLEIMPVTKIDDKQIGNGKPGLMTQKIRSFYKQRVKREIGSISA